MARGRIRSFLFGGLIGAAVAYFTDPDRGRGRRARTRDQLAATVRRGGRRLERVRRRTGAQVYGVAQKAAHPVPEQTEFDDKTLTEKVKTELFGDPDVPKGQINVNVEEGVVVLRGEVDRPEQIRALEDSARSIAGVQDVKNLLHLPGTPPKQA